METPYRLKILFSDIVKLMAGEFLCVLAYELTKENEKFYCGNAGDILNHVERENLKREFVLVIKNK